MQGKFNPAYEPRPTAIYFRNVRRGLLGMIQKAIREFLPSLALLGLDFIGSSVLEVITDAGLVERTGATLKLMEIVQIPNVYIFEAAAGEPQ